MIIQNKVIWCDLYLSPDFSGMYLWFMMIMFE